MGQIIQDLIDHGKIFELLTKTSRKLMNFSDEWMKLMIFFLLFEQKYDMKYSYFHLKISLWIP